jgi:hypothetical protein
MAEFCPDLDARVVDERLKASLEELRLAEKNAVLWFAEVMQRKLYLELGYSSIQQYAELELGFKRARTSQFIRLSQSLWELPKLRESVARGEVSWTKAREVSGVATRKTESAWIAEARKSTSRELERKVAITKGRARALRSGAGAQGEIPAAGTVGAPGGEESFPVPLGGKSVTAARDMGVENSVRPEDELPIESGVESSVAALAGEVPCDLRHRLSPTQCARYEALVEKLRKLGIAGSREELLLECLEIAVEVRATSRDRVSRVAASRSGSRRGETPETTPEGDPEEWGLDATKAGAVPEFEPGEFPRGNPRNSSGRYQVGVWMCGRCGTGTVETSRGPMKLAPATLKAILCDARVRKQGERNRSVLPERIRRQVLERDRMRCRGAGCNRTAFLAVHHLVPREAGGTHDPANLVTLCEGCHRAAHRHTESIPIRRVAPERIPP